MFTKILQYPRGRNFGIESHVYYPLQEIDLRKRLTAQIILDFEIDLFRNFTCNRSARNKTNTHENKHVAVRQVKPETTVHNVQYNDITLGTGLGSLQGPNGSIVPRRNVHTGPRQDMD